MLRIVCLISLLIFCSLPVVAKGSSVVLQKAQTFFDLYAERKNFDAFMAMYSEDAEVQDITYGNHVLGRQAIRDFFQWDAGNVKFLENTSLVLNSMLNEGNQVVARGYFTRFEYAGQELGPWRFVIWLEFDETGKIIKQTDWINYTPKEQFTGGKNMNELINKG